MEGAVGEIGDYRITLLESSGERWGTRTPNRRAPAMAMRSDIK